MGSLPTITYAAPISFFGQKCRYNFAFEATPGSKCLHTFKVEMYFHFFSLNLLPSQDLDQIIFYTYRSEQ